MKISIALASYNGARFIGEQLESFAAQTLKPDEVVICDDGSTDDTFSVVESFARRSAFPVHFHANSERLGYTRNFERAISLCTGDIIFLSDQDDVWFENKLEIVAARFEQEPAAQVVVNDQMMTDGALRPSGVTKLENLRRLGSPTDGLIEGCCTALRREWRDCLFPIGEDLGDLVQPALLSYDRWINEIAIILGVRQVIDQPLQLFRRHGDNSTTWLLSEPRPVGVLDLVATRLKSVPSEAWRQRVRLLDHYQSWLLGKEAQILGLGISSLPLALKRVADERASLLARIRLTHEPLPRRVALISRMLLEGRYAYFYGWKSALRDLVRSEVR